MTAVENQIPDVSSLVKKTDYNIRYKIRYNRYKISDHDHDHWITTSEFNKLTTENFAARLAQINLAKRTKHLLVENELKTLKTFDSSYFRGRNYFVGNDGTQNYLVFQSMFKYFKKIGNTKLTSEWKSKGLSDEIIKPPSALNRS